MPRSQHGEYAARVASAQRSAGALLRLSLAQLPDGGSEAPCQASHSPLTRPLQLRGATSELLYTTVQDIVEMPEEAEELLLTTAW